jgi:hypothetical protein
MDFPENCKFRAQRNTAARNLLSLYQGQHSIADVCIGGHLTGSPETQPFGRNTWQDGNAH